MNRIEYGVYNKSWFVMNSISLKNGIILVLIFSIPCFFSCKQGSFTRESNGRVDTTVYYSNNDVDEQEGGYVIDDAEFERLITAVDIEGIIIPKVDFEKYGLPKFYPKPELDNNKYKSIKAFDFSFLDEKVEVVLIAQYGGNIERAWIASYSFNGKLIDSYMVYSNGEKFEYIENHKVRSTVNLDNGAVVVYDNNVFFFDEMEIPIDIYPNGILEVFPEEEYSDLNYADGCGTNSFYGKYPLDEDWTILDLKGKKVESAKTVKHYSDELNGVTTIFDKKVGDYYNVGVKGKHLPDNVSFVAVDTVELLDNSMKQLIDDAKTDLDIYRYGGNQDYTISASFKYSSSEGNYYLLVVSVDYSTDSYKDVKDMLVGVFEDKAYPLASMCFYLEYDGINVFIVDGIPYIYAVSTSCGEGAAADRHMYKMNKGFEEVFQLFTSHD